MRKDFGRTEPLGWVNDQNFWDQVNEIWTLAEAIRVVQLLKNFLTVDGEFDLLLLENIVFASQDCTIWSSDLGCLSKGSHTYCSFVPIELNPWFLIFINRQPGRDLKKYDPEAPHVMTPWLGALQLVFEYFRWHVFDVTQKFFRNFLPKSVTIVKAYKLNVPQLYTFKNYRNIFRAQRSVNKLVSLELMKNFANFFDEYFHIVEIRVFTKAPVKFSVPVYGYSLFPMKLVDSLKKGQI